MICDLLSFSSNHAYSMGLKEERKTMYMYTIIHHSSEKLNMEIHLNMYVVCPNFSIYPSSCFLLSPIKDKIAGKVVSVNGLIINQVKHIVLLPNAGGRKLDLQNSQLHNPILATKEKVFS